MIKPYKPLLLSFLCLLMGSCDMIDYHRMMYASTVRPM